MCAECGGSALCTHGNNRANCKICAGCEHGKIKKIAQYVKVVNMVKTNIHVINAIDVRIMKLNTVATYAIGVNIIKIAINAICVRAASMANNIKHV